MSLRATASVTGPVWVLCYTSSSCPVTLQNTHSGTYSDGGLMQRKLQLLLDAGLDINSNCCSLGTPIDRAIRLDCHFRILIPSPLAEQIERLQRHGAPYTPTEISEDIQLQNEIVSGECVSYNTVRRPPEVPPSAGLQFAEPDESTRL